MALVSSDFSPGSGPMTDWSEIVRQHGPLVWRTACRLLKNEADAADCFQRAFLSALEVERKQAIDNWPGLLKWLTTARALECLRQRRRQSNRSEPVTEGLLIDRKGIGPLQAAQGSELADRLADALADLEPQQAEVFCLACLEGFSYQETAQKLGIVPNHVGVLLHRARSRLQQALEAYGPPPVAQRLSREVES